MTIFDILQDIIRDKRGNLHENEEFRKTFSSFMVRRYLSFRGEFFDVVRDTAHLAETLEPEQYYKLLVKMIPRSVNAYCPYITKKSK